MRRAVVTVEARRPTQRRWPSILVLAVDTVVLLYGTLLVWIFLGPRIDGESPPGWLAWVALTGGVVVGLVNVSLIAALVRRRPSDVQLVVAVGGHALLAGGIAVTSRTELGFAGAATLIVATAVIWSVVRRAYRPT